MKGYVKKMKTKRVLATMLAVLMVLTISIPQTVNAASPDARYTGTGNIKDLLTDFQYVIKGDATLYNHTVGSVAIGGNLNSYNYIGDCAQRPSYAKHIIATGVGNASDFMGSTRDFYYGTSANTLYEPFMQNPNYMDVPALYVGSTGLVQQAKDLAANNVGQIATSALDPSQNFQMITIDFGVSNSWTIPYDVLKTAKGINFVNSSNADDKFEVNDLSSEEYIINIVGVNGEEVLFDGEAWLGGENSGYTDLFINGSKSQFLGELDNPVNGIQCNLSGMKLIWNFPDATGTVKWNGMGGHLVAPQAHANVTSGRFEGGIIAASVESTGQAHYFPYNTFGISEDGTEIVAKDIYVKKTYLLSNGSLTTPSEQAKFTLYEDEACTTAVTGAVNVPVDASTGYVTFDSEALGLELDRSYYVKETYAPPGFEINDTVYECAISVGGLITYREVVAGNTTYVSSMPIYENLMRTYTDTEEEGTLVVTVEDIDNNRAKVKDAKIQVVKINDDGSRTMIDVLTTPENGVVSYTDLEPGKYEVSIIVIPDGYLAPGEKVVTVNVQHTTYHTFELSQEREDIKVNLEDTDGNIVSGGYVEIIDSKGQSYVEYVGSSGYVVFEDVLSDDYKVILVQTPLGYNDPNPVEDTIIVSTTKDTETVNKYTYVLDKKDGTVIVNILDSSDAANVDYTKTTVGGTVTITYPDGTTTVSKLDADDGNLDGVVTFEGVPVGTCAIKVSTAPADYLLISNSSDADVVSSKEITVVENETTEEDLYVEKVAEKGNLTIEVVDTDTSDDCVQNDNNKVTVKVTSPDGTVTTYNDVYIDTTVIPMNDVPVGTYTVEIQTPNGWKTVKATVSSTEDTTTPTSVDADVVANATTNVVFTVDAIGGMKITVVDDATGNPINGATVEIKQGNTVIKTETTLGDGTITVNGLDTGDYEVNVTSVPNGYVNNNSSQTITVTQNKVAEQEFRLITTATVEVNVREVDTDNPISGATVYLIKDGGSIDDVNDVVKSQYVGSTGDVTFTDIVPGDYDVVISIDAIDDTWKLAAGEVSSKDQEIVSGDNGNVLFELTKQTSDLRVTVVYIDDGVPVTGEKVLISVKDEQGNDVSLSANESDAGIINNDDIPVGVYTITLEQVPTDYILPDGTLELSDGTKETAVHTNVKVEAGTGGETIFYVSKVDTTQNVGSLQVNVYLKDETPEDLSDNDAFTSAVEIKYVPLSGAATTENVNTTEALKLDKSDLPAGNYTTVLTIPTGYTLVADMANNTATQTKAVGAGETTVINYVLEAAGTVNVTVKDDDGNNIPEADVILKDSEGNKVDEGTTDSDGKVTFTEVPVGNYVVEITEVPNKFDMPEDTTYDVQVTPGGTVNEVFELPLAGDIVVTVYEYGTTNVVEGATVVLQNESDTVIAGPETSDEDGKVYFPGLEDGDYKVVITAAPTGYSIVDPSIKTDIVKVELKVNERDKNADFFVDALGSMKVTIVEDGTATPIPNAEVQIKDSKGNIIKDGTNDYFVTSDVVGSEGTITINNLPAGTYTANVLTVPSPYKIPNGGGSTLITVVKNQTAEEELVVAATTTLTITVKDEETGDILDDETNGKTTLVVEDQYGEKKQVTTTAGTVTINNWAVSTPTGSTTVTITKVPSSHIIPTAADKVTTTVEVVKGQSNSHEVEAPKAPTTTGNLVITVTDEVKNVTVPDAYVEITYPDGSKEQTYTDADGKISRPDVTTGNYTVTILAVPSGYTTPSQTVTKITVKEGNNSVNIVIKTPVITGGATSNKTSKSNNTSDETIAKAPKTGDISYMPIAVAMMVISLIGLTGVVVYRKKTENDN